MSEREDEEPIPESPFVPYPIPRQEFQKGTFDHLLEQRGLPFDWYRASFCFCQIKSLNQPNPVCKFCEGSGYVYHKPVPIKAMLLSTGSNDQFMQLLGLYQPGQAFVSVSYRVHLGIKDRLVSQLSRIVFKEVLEYSQDVELKLRYEPTKVLSFLVFGGEEYHKHEDYYFKGRSIVFKEGKAPKFGTYISVDYMHKPIWIVQGFPNLHREEIAEDKLPHPEISRLPVRAKVMLDFLVDKGGPGALIGDEGNR